MRPHAFIKRNKIQLYKSKIIYCLLIIRRNDVIKIIYNNRMRIKLFRNLKLKHVSIVFCAKRVCATFLISTLCVTLAIGVITHLGVIIPDHLTLLSTVQYFFHFFSGPWDLIRFIATKMHRLTIRKMQKSILLPFTL